MTKPGVHLPSRADWPQRRRSDFLFRCRARTLLALPAPAACAASAPRSRRDPDAAAGGAASQTPQVTLPPLRSKPSNSGRAGLPPRARAQKRAATHTPGAGAARSHPSARSPPFLACSLAPPGPSRAPGPRGGASAEATPAWELGLGIGSSARLRARALTWIGYTCDVFTWAAWAAGEPSERTVHLLGKCLTTL